MVGYGKPIVFLHGWEANHNTFNKLIEKLSDGYSFYLLDLPGFGDTVIDSSLTVYEVCDLVHKFIIKLNIINPVIIFLFIRTPLLYFVLLSTFYHNKI